MNSESNKKTTGSKSNNYETNTKTEDLALAETTYLIPSNEVPVEELTEEQIDNAVVMENGVTSIDFMLPQEEYEILSKNINKYSDTKKMKNLLNIAKQTKLLINEYIQQKLEAGDVAKAYKELGLMNKAMIDAREGMINRINTTESGKKTRIALRFTNDSGQDFQLGAEING